MSDNAAAIYLAARAAADTHLCAITARTDCAKVLRLAGDHASALLLEQTDDETFGAAIAQAIGRATGPRRPRGRLIDPDEKPRD